MGLTGRSEDRQVHWGHTVQQADPGAFVAVRCWAHTVPEGALDRTAPPVSSSIHAVR